ncbi:phage integrase SAM-like domain-containing protein [Andreesenia angusta]|uniref:phage integrase SAM-like domain-containing protein n=1 Tax=Andreesenia angusta TaxID=39480 RepID=UPI0009FE7063
MSESDIESYLGYIRSRNLSKNTRNRNLYTLRSFYSFALKKDLVSINPAINIPPLSVNSGERNFLSFSDFEALISKIEDSVAKNIIHIMWIGYT